MPTEVQSVCFPKAAGSDCACDDRATGRRRARSNHACADSQRSGAGASAAASACASSPSPSSITCCACLALPLTACQVHQVKLANPNVAVLHTCSHTQARGVCIRHNTSNRKAVGLRTPDKSMCMAANMTQAHTHKQLHSSYVHAHRCRPLLDGLNGDAEHRVRPGAVLVHERRANRAVLLAYLRCLSMSAAHAQAATCIQTQHSGTPCLCAC